MSENTEENMEAAKWSGHLIQSRVALKSAQEKVRKLRAENGSPNEIENAETERKFAEKRLKDSEAGLKNSE